MSEYNEEQQQSASTLAEDYRAVAAAATKVAEIYENLEGLNDKEAFLAEYDFVDKGGRLAQEFVATCLMNGGSPQELKEFFEGQG